MWKHAANYNGNDVTLCGIANDIADGIEGAENPQYAIEGELVTCADCQAIILHAVRHFIVSRHQPAQVIYTPRKPR